ncbi:MAG: hypothetical protein HQM09_19160 [Candidatus Riflebacteria bacterium]|nr:hypothetical protein [Candidatus Riflebacteria bacterium]
MILSVTDRLILLCGPAGVLKDAIRERNQQILRVFDNLLKITTFNPQVKKKIEGGGGPGVIGNRKTWISNCRTDLDNRIAITGYALGAKEVTQLGDDMLKSGSFVEVYISNMNKNVFEKVPVWRFDITARIK